MSNRKKVKSPSNTMTMKNNSLKRGGRIDDKSEEGVWCVWGLMGGTLDTDLKWAMFHHSNFFVAREHTNIIQDLHGDMCLLYGSWM